MSTLCTASLQLALVENNQDANMVKIRDYARLAAQEKPDLIIIPELAIEGYDFSYVESFSDNDFLRIREFYADLARELKTPILAGTVERANGHFYDSALYLNDQGEGIYVYQKIHLWDKETEFFTPGQEYGMIDIKGWKIGIGICADAGFPEFARSLVLQGADLLVYVSAWVKPYADSWTLMCKARACENQSYVVGVNRIGTAAGTQYCGHSIVVEPSGGISNDCLEEEGAFVNTLDKSEIVVKRKEIPWLAMRRPDLYIN